MKPTERTGTIRCGEWGTPEWERWSPSFRASSDDTVHLRHLHASHIVELREEADGALSVAGRAHCGRIRLPSGSALDIASKVPTVSLLAWLAHVEKLPELKRWEHDPSLALHGSVVDALLALFIDALTQITRFHWRRGYAATRALAQSFRGRLDIARFGASSSRLPRLPTVQRERTFDTPANRVLARALDAAWMLSDGHALPEETRRKLDWLRRQWANVARETVDLPKALVTALAAPPVGYRSALLLARLLLYRATIDAVGGDGGHCFLIDMSLIWERSFRRMLGSWARSRGIPVAEDSERTRSLDDARGHQDASRYLTVDALVKGAVPIVFDAKYKRDFAVEAREDVFQMAAYALGFGASAAVLVYPTALEGWRYHRLLRAAAPHPPTVIGSLELPMAVGPTQCSAVATEALSALHQALLDEETQPSRGSWHRFIGHPGSSSPV